MDLIIATCMMSTKFIHFSIPPPPPPQKVYMFSYQCSQLSTPESVIDVFQKAEKFQSHQDTTQYVSVVVLDNVGLAEDSPNLPLKALHPLLEDGTEGAGKDDQQKAICCIILCLL